MSWTDERVETLKSMWSDGKSASQIAKELGGVTRNAVIGKVHRLGLSNRVGGEHPDDMAAPAEPAVFESRRARSRGCRRRNPPRRRARLAKDPMPAVRPKPVPGQPMPPQPSASEISAEALANLAEIAKKARRLNLMQLTERTCKWPVGDPATDDFWFCGLPTVPGQALLRDPRRGRLPADVRPPRPPRRRPLTPIGLRSPPSRRITRAGQGRSDGNAARRQGRARHRRQLRHRPRARADARRARARTSPSPPAPPSAWRRPAPPSAPPRRSSCPPTSPAPPRSTAWSPPCIDRFGRIDILLANAGLYVPGDVEDGDPAAWEEMIAVNVSSVFRAIRAVLPGMIERRSGHIIVTSSISGHAALHWEPVYSATKHAIQSFVHGLRRQVAPLRPARRRGLARHRAERALGPAPTPRTIAEKAEAHEGLLSEDVADAVRFMLTRPARVTIRDVVILPQNQDI